MHPPSSPPPTASHDFTDLSLSKTPHSMTDDDLPAVLDSWNMLALLASCTHDPAVCCQTQGIYARDSQAWTVNQARSRLAFI